MFRLSNLDWSRSRTLSIRGVRDKTPAKRDFYERTDLKNTHVSSLEGQHATQAPSEGYATQSESLIIFTIPQLNAPPTCLQMATKTGYRHPPPRRVFRGFAPWQRECYFKKETNLLGVKFTCEMGGGGARNLAPSQLISSRNQSAPPPKFHW